MSDYVVVVQGLIADDGEVSARIHQMDEQEVSGWRVTSARCHIHATQGLDHRLGRAVSYLLGAEHPLIITRSGDRVTICEVEMDEDVVSHSGQVDIPSAWVQTIHEAVLFALDGRLTSQRI